MPDDAGSEVPTGVAAAPLVPRYGGPCLTGIVPGLLGPRGARPEWLAEVVGPARQVVLLVLDGLGWDQLHARRALAPTLAGMRGRAIHSVAPTTTATALTSITTGAAPGEHGVVGYRIAIDRSVLNVLRWSTPEGDARRRFPPEEIQPLPPFLGSRPVMVNKADFAVSGFSAAHLRGAELVGWRMPSTMVVEIGRVLRAGAPFVYAYYDGVDKVAHEYGLAGAYDAEVVAVDRLVADVQAVLPPGATLVVTSDHGQVDVGERTLPPAPGVLALTASQSGEGRFRWLHARSGAASDLLAAARAAHEDVAWVVGLEQVRDEQWFGPRVTPEAARRLGDVALVARAPVSFDDPADSGPMRLIARHGSLTPAEVLVPLLAADAG